LTRICETILPGSRAARVRRLRGGISSGMHAFDLLEPSGARRALVLRRYGDWAVTHDSGVAERAWRTLGALERIGMLAPRPVWFDGGGEVFGTPAYVMTRVPGRGELCPRDRRGWLRQLAEALAALHRTATAGLDLSFLPAPDADLDQQSGTAAPEKLAAHPDGAAVLAALHGWRPHLLPVAPVLNHGDYWPGNTLWRRGRLTAVIDWDDAALGPPGADVGYCRTDLALVAGGDAPDIFLEAYEAAAGYRIPQLFFWDLAGAKRALPDPAPWVTAYHDLGRTDLTLEQVRDRLRAFIAGALMRAADAAAG